MRRIVNSTYVSLDGAIENPQDWPSGRHEDDGRGLDIQTELLSSCDAVLMGRRTYEGFAPVWSARSGDPYSDRINAIEEWVVSTTLSDPKWNNTVVIDADVVDEIRARKERPGGDIVQYGFGELSYTLLEHGLIDELRLWVHPFLVGHATPNDLLFRRSSGAMFELADTIPLTSGIVVLTYRA
ncbi:MAG: dihydrofolate reductase family protein [Solirubrobacteraceae bacterium]